MECFHDHDHTTSTLWTVTNRRATSSWFGRRVVDSCPFGQLSPRLSIAPGHRLEQRRHPAWVFAGVSPSLLEHPPGTTPWHHTARQVAHGVAREPPGVRDERRSLPPLPARVHRVGEAVQVEYHGPRRALLVAHDDRKPFACCRGPELGVASSVHACPWQRAGQCELRAILVWSVLMMRHFIEDRSQDRVDRSAVDQPDVPARPDS